LNALEEFRVLGLNFVSLKEAVDTSMPYGRMLFTILASVAELERDIIKERIALGLMRARKEGKVLGRPRRIFDHDKAVQLRYEGTPSVQLLSCLVSARIQSMRCSRIGKHWRGHHSQPRRAESQTT
jgi:DNA invertase Pin-like site-specific DNA recombinase